MELSKKVECICLRRALKVDLKGSAGFDLCTNNKDNCLLINVMKVMYN